MSVSIKIIFAITFFIFFLTIPIFFYPKIIDAQNVNVQCNGKFSDYVQSVTFSDDVPLGETFPISVKFKSVADTSFKYSIKATQLGAGVGPINVGNFDIRSDTQQIKDSTINFTMASNNQDHIGAFQVSLMHSEGLGEEQVCSLGTINFFDKNLNETTCNIKMPDNINQNEASFPINLYKTDKSGIAQVIYIYNQQDLNLSILPKGVTYLEPDAGTPPVQAFAPNNRIYDSGELSQNSPGSNGINLTYDNSGGKRLNGGNYIAVVEARRFLGNSVRVTGIPPSTKVTPTNKYFVFYCNYHSFTVSSDPTSSPTDGNIITNPGGGGIVGGGILKSETCLEKAKKDPTVKCAESGGQPCDPNSPSIKTAIGCIHTNPAEFAKDLLRFVIGISGGLAFLMMLLGAFQMLTSAGNPETLNAGKQRLTSAIIGLLMVIFAVLLLQIIGVGILAIPGFGP